jgi:hypothetical protein
VAAGDGAQLDAEVPGGWGTDNWVEGGSVGAGGWEQLFERGASQTIMGTTLPPQMATADPTPRSALRHPDRLTPLQRLVNKADGNHNETPDMPRKLDPRPRSLVLRPR